MTTYRIAVIGGTGPQGKGLGYRFARAGHSVVLGSRSCSALSGFFSSRFRSCLAVAGT